jgi:hypothetical protein
MSENTNPTEVKAREFVNLNTTEDIAYWKRKWGITTEQLQLAVERSGNKERRVADYLRYKGYIRF